MSVFETRSENTGVRYNLEPWSSSNIRESSDSLISVVIFFFLTKTRGIRRYLYSNEVDFQEGVMHTSAYKYPTFVYRF